MRMRDNLSDPGTDFSSGCGLSDAGARRQMGPGSGSIQLRRSRSRSSTPASASATGPATSLAGGYGGDGLVAARLRASRRTLPTEIQAAVARDFVDLGLNQRYCVRVRARSNRDSSNNEVYGDYTELDNQDGTGWGFQWIGYPAGGACTPSCNAGYLGSGDYVLPAAGSTVTQTPLITWRPLAGRASYFVIVAKDPSFTNLVDYAFTQLPAYAPRTAFSPDHVPGRDDAPTTGSSCPRCRRTGTEPSAIRFSERPRGSTSGRSGRACSGPRTGRSVPGQPTFRWTLALGARRYRLQVSQDPSFGDPIDDILTDATVAHEQHDLSGRHGPLLAGPRRRREPHRPHLVGDRHVPEAASRAGRERLEPERAETSSPPGPGTRSSAPRPTTSVPTFRTERIGISPGCEQRLSRRSSCTAPASSTGRCGPTSRRHCTALFRAHTRRYPLFHANDRRAERRALRPVSAACAPELGTEGRSEALSRADRVPPGLREDHRGLHDRQHELRAAADAARIPRRQSLSFYWRVAGVDGGNNVGDFTPVTQIGTAKPLRLTARGNPVRGRSTAVSFAVTGPTGAPVEGALVRVSGAGPGARPRGRTAREGRLCSAKARGTITFRATKAGYQPVGSEPRSIARGGSGACGMPTR